mmetsp:Transcript_10121/g.24922  ORF Transcript_10121/g.24922 Transcript_10121/m.24922 type:complete len:187 (+) Transcript_10121:244-804(+)
MLRQPERTVEKNPKEGNPPLKALIPITVLLKKANLEAYEATFEQEKVRTEQLMDTKDLKQFLTGKLKLKNGHAARLVHVLKHEFQVLDLLEGEWQVVWTGGASAKISITNGGWNLHGHEYQLESRGFAGDQDVWFTWGPVPRESEIVKQWTSIARECLANGKRPKKIVWSTDSKLSNYRTITWNAI